MNDIQNQSVTEPTLKNTSNHAVPGSVTPVSTSSSKPKSRITSVALTGLIAVLSLLTIALNSKLQQNNTEITQLGASQQQNPDQAPAGTIVKDQYQVDFQEYTPTNPVAGNGKTDSFVITDSTDEAWIAYRPLNLSITPNNDDQTVTISWNENQLNPKPYTWSVGYSNQTYSAVEKFQVNQLSAAEQINWFEISKQHPLFESVQKTVVLKAESSDQLFFSLYARIKNNKNEYIDLVYSSDNTTLTPYSVQFN